MTPNAKKISMQIKRVAQERGVSYAEVLTEFLIERAVIRLVAVKFLYDRLVFKGGFVGLRVYGSPRYTTDLDAVIRYQDQREVLDNARKSMEKDLDDSVWFRFEAQVDLDTQNEYGGIRLQFRSGLGEPLENLRRAQIINLDIGTGDPITPGAVEKITETTLGGGEVSWFVYPIETIIAEKLHPIAHLGAANSRSKDIFDLAFYLPNASPEVLREAIARTFKYRGDSPPKNMAGYIEKMDVSLLRKGWRSATASIRPAPPDFDQVLEKVISMLKEYEI